MKTLKQMNEKQLLVLQAARDFAYAFVQSAPTLNDAKKAKVNAFMTGYLKGLKDCGYDLFDVESLEAIEEA